MNIITKLRHKIAGEQCPKCKSYKIVQGKGYAGLKCVTCNNEYELRDQEGLADAPQVEGANTIYEEHLNSKRFEL